jgi:single-strand DNA-binding protein
MSINSVTLSGNLGRDPELRTTAAGGNLLTFSIAVNDRVKDSSTGEWKDYTNWVDVVVFGNRAESLSRILTKGMKVTINGKIRYSSWEKDGQTRSKIEVIANDVDIMQRREDNGYANSGQTYSAPKQQTRRQAAPAYDDFDDSIPF